MGVVPSNDLITTNALAATLQRLDLLFKIVNELAIKEKEVTAKDGSRVVLEKCHICGNYDEGTVEHKPNCPISRYQRLTDQGVKVGTSGTWNITRNSENVSLRAFCQNGRVRMHANGFVLFEISEEYAREFFTDVTSKINNISGSEKEEQDGQFKQET